MALDAEQLWGLTPREYSALLAEWSRAQEWRHYYHAAIQATLHNAHFPCQCNSCQEKAKAQRQVHHEPWTVEDFLPGAKRTPETEQQKLQRMMGSQSVEEKMARIKMMLTMAGGAAKRG